MFEKGSVIVNTTSKMVYKVVEHDNQAYSYVLKQLYPEVSGIVILRRDFQDINEQCKKVL